MSQYQSTKFPGVRTREHATRKHGIRPDRYFLIRYQTQGKRKEEGLGWASEGWTAEKAAVKLAELKQAAKTGEGAKRLSEKRAARKKADQEAAARRKAEERRATTYEQYFRGHYLPEVEHDKSRVAVRDEKSIHKNSILPNIGNLPILHIGELDLKRITRAMNKAGRAPRTIQLALAHVRMVINHAIRSGYHAGPNPVSTMPRNSKPKVENRRLRFFTPDEAGDLLERLLSRSKDVHDMTLLSIYCGLRAGEIFKLTWRYVDLANRLVTLVETKSGKDRTVPMPEKVYNMFLSRTEGPGNALVFPDTKGKQRVRMSKTFERTVDAMGLNEGVTDRKNKLVFHSCRHTCASWLVQAGVPLLTVKEILGHSTIALTERYSHLAPDGTRAALQVMEKAIQESRTESNVQQLVNAG
jgi:integrase